jgi:hypothetical protein
MRKLILYLFLFALAVLWQAPCHAALDILPLEKVRAGMKGQGRTVFRGSEPQPFDVEVLGILPGGGPGGGDMILVRVSGALMQSQGGVALGMSGSPIYFNGKLAGALSSTFAESDHSLAGVTPIQDMLQAYDYLKPPGKVRLDPPVTVNGVAYRMLDYTSTETGPHVLHAVSAVAPVAIRGVSERTYEFLKPFFTQSGLELMPFESLPAGRETGARSKGGSADIGRGKDLKPGASVAVQLVRGDIDISAVGTVTAIDGNKVLAFGHPFFRKGAVDYLLADAPVLAIMNSPNLSFKITATGLLRGSIRQDRGSGIIGYLDKYPLLTPMSVIVEDMDIGRKREYHVKIVQDQDLLSELIVSVLINAIDNTIDRLGPGTATMDFSLKAEGLDRVIERKNMFYSGNDVSAASLQELMMALSLLKENYFQEAGISGLKAHIRLKAAHDTAAIVKAELFDPETGKILGGSEDKDKKSKAGESEENGNGPDADASGSQPDDEEEIAGDTDNPEDAEDEAIEEDMDDYPDEELEDPYADSGEDENGDAVAGDEESGDSGAGARNRQGAQLRRRSSRSARELVRVRPGQKLGLKITVRPYKKDEIVQNIFLKIPDDIPEGTAVVRIFSGIKYMSPWFGMQGTFFDFMMQDFMPTERGPRDPRDGRKKYTLDDIIKKFLERDLNNELVATIASMSAAPPKEKREDLEEEEFRDEEDDGAWDEYDIEAPPPDRAKKATDWVLFGSSSIRVRVAKGGGDSSLKQGGIEKSKIKTLEQKNNGR